MSENRCKNESEAVEELINAYQRFQIIVRNLEKQAHEVEVWKNRAHQRVKNEGTTE